MQVFQNTETLPILLMNYLQSRKLKCCRWSTAFCSLPKRPKLRYLLENQNFKGFLQTTHWYSRAWSGKIWWFSTSGSQSSSRWRKWIAKQSSTRCSGTRLGNTVDTIIPMWNRNFWGNAEELATVLGADEETKSHLDWQFPRIWQSLWRSFLESFYVNTAQIGSKRDGCKSQRRVKEGTSAALMQSGLDKEWWADSMERCCYLRNVQDLLSDGKTPYEKQFGMPFNGPVTPFGAMVSYHHILRRTYRDSSIWSESLARKIRHLCNVCGWDLERERCRRRHWRIGGDGRMRTPHPKAQWKGSVNAFEWCKVFIFPIADGAVQIFGRELRPRTSTLTWERPERSENKFFEGNSDEWYPPSHLQEDSARDDEVKNDFWSGSENIHPNQGSSRTRRRTRKSSRRVRRNFFNPTSRLIVVWWWCSEWFLVHSRQFYSPSSRGTQSQTKLHVPRGENPFLFHWNILTFPGLQISPWM